MGDKMARTERAKALPSGGEFIPELLSSMRAGYGAPQFRQDLSAGLTVAVVALPLSMALAIASGLAPEKGLIAAIIGGLIVSGLGGCRFQIDRVHRRAAWL
jgi:sulfate permease, SulP family